MPYATCSKGHINRIPEGVYEDQLAHFKCGKPGCDTLLRRKLADDLVRPNYMIFDAERTFGHAAVPQERGLPYARPASPARPATAFESSSAPLPAYDPPPYAQPSSFQPFTPGQPLPMHQPSGLPAYGTPVTMQASSSQSAYQPATMMQASSSFAAASAAAMPAVASTPDMMDDPYPRARQEATSQAELYEVLTQQGYLFLCVDGLFRSYPDPLIVEEPGVENGQFKIKEGQIVGRLADHTPYQKGTVSFPDFVVKNVSDPWVCMVELKTPSASCQDITSYLAGRFDGGPETGESIVLQLKQRHTNMPKTMNDRPIRAILLFDVSNLASRLKGGKLETAAKDLAHYLKNYEAGKWLADNVYAVMLYQKGEAPVFNFMAALLAGDKPAPKGQPRMDSFFSVVKK